MVAEITPFLNSFVFIVEKISSPYTIFLLNLIILLIKTSNGEMAEPLKAPVLKTGKGATLSWVRIPVSPPSFFIISKFPKKFRNLVFLNININK